MKVGKRYAECLKAYDKTKVYEVEEAMDVVLNTSKAKFDETVEFHVRLGVDPKQAYESCIGKYGRFDDAPKHIDPRKE